MKGLDIFRRHFEGLSHHYVLIGGAACAIIMEEVGLDFRATKDLDLVILVDGVAVLDERLLIPFKAKAHLDLAMRRSKGEIIDRKNVRKHRTDVFRLLQLLPEAERVVLPEAIAADMASFAAKVDADGDFQPKAIGLPGDAAAQTARLCTIYGITAA